MRRKQAEQSDGKPVDQPRGDVYILDRAIPTLDLQGHRFASVGQCGGHDDIEVFQALAFAGNLDDPVTRLQSRGLGGRTRYYPAHDGRHTGNPGHVEKHQDDDRRNDIERDTGDDDGHADAGPLVPEGAWI